MPTYLERVNLLFQMRRHADAEPLLREALAENPDDALAHAMLGLVLSNLGKKDAAIAESVAAIGSDPTSSYAFYARSLVLIRANRPVGALEAIREAIRLGIDDPDYFMILSALLFDRERWEESLEAADQGLAIDPRHVECLHHRGHALLQLGRNKEADLAFTAAVAAEPEHAEAHYSRGVFLLQRAEAADALSHLLEARRLDPNATHDVASIALAAGRSLPPIRWLGWMIPRWTRWPPKVRWAVFMLLLLTYVGLNIAFPPLGGHGSRPFSIGQLPVIVFGAIVLNLMLAPFTLDALATSLASLVNRKLIGPTPPSFTGHAALGYCGVLLHLPLTVVAMLPEFVVPALALAGCYQTFGYLARCRSRGLPLNLYLGACGVVLFLLANVIRSNIFNRPRLCLLLVVFLAALSFFSDLFARRLEQSSREVDRL